MEGVFVRSRKFKWGFHSEEEWLLIVLSMQVILILAVKPLDALLIAMLASALQAMDQPRVMVLIVQNVLQENIQMLLIQQNVQHVHKTVVQHLHSNSAPVPTHRKVFMVVNVLHATRMARLLARLTVLVDASLDTLKILMALAPNQLVAILLHALTLTSKLPVIVKMVVKVVLTQQKLTLKSASVHLTTPLTAPASVLRIAQPAH